MKEQHPKGHSPKISISGQNVFEMLAQLCSDDSIQILLNLIQFVTLVRRICMET